MQRDSGYLHWIGCVCAGHQMHSSSLEARRKLQEERHHDLVLQHPITSAIRIGIVGFALVEIRLGNEFCFWRVNEFIKACDLLENIHVGRERRYHPHVMFSQLLGKRRNLLRIRLCVGWGLEVSIDEKAVQFFDMRDRILTRVDCAFNADIPRYMANKANVVSSGRVDDSLVGIPRQSAIWLDEVVSLVRLLIDLDRKSTRLNSSH